MKKLAMIAVMMSATTSWAAGDAGSAMEIAAAQQACGENGTILSARFVDGGKVEATCATAVAAVGSSAGGLGSSAALLGVAAAVLAAAAAGGGGSSSSDTQ